MVLAATSASISSLVPARIWPLLTVFFLPIRVYLQHLIVFRDDSTMLVGREGYIGCSYKRTIDEAAGHSKSYPPGSNTRFFATLQRS